jgi:hypothetical protein
MGNGTSTTRGALQGLGYGTWFALLSLFAVIYVGSTFSPALLDDAASTHAEAAREMAVSGDYVTLHVHGVRYLEKAPLPYWLVALSYRLLGVNEFATRLPTVLAMLLLSVLGVQWAGRAFGGHSAIYGGLFVATAAGAFLFAHRRFALFFLCGADRARSELALVCRLCPARAGRSGQRVGCAGVCWRDCAPLLDCHR